MKRLIVPQRFVDEFNEQSFQDAVELAITVDDNIQPTDKLYRRALQAIYDAMQQEKLQHNPPVTGRLKRKL